MPRLRPDRPDRRPQPHVTPASTRQTRRKRPAGGAPAGQRPSSRKRHAPAPPGTPRAGRARLALRRSESTTLSSASARRSSRLPSSRPSSADRFLFASAAQPTFACTRSTTGTPSRVEGELGQIQPDMGNQHVSPGDKVTYPICPPASGKHINRAAAGTDPAQVLRAERQRRPERLGPQPGARRPRPPVLVRQGRLRRRHPGAAARARVGLPGERRLRDPARDRRAPSSRASSRCRRSSRPCLGPRPVHGHARHASRSTTSYLQYAERVSRGPVRRAAGAAVRRRRRQAPVQVPRPATPRARPGASPSTPASPVASPSTGASPAASPATSAEPSPAAS